MTELRDLYLRLTEEGPDNLLGWVVFLVLWPFSCCYGLLIYLRLLAYSMGLKKTYHASVPVVSVGNLSIGGTGKTPMTDFLAKWMVDLGLPVAIVSRGYGGHYTAQCLRVNPVGENMTNPVECGDEPFLLAKRNPAVPVFVARRRAEGVEAAEKTGAKLIILDDGFQHRAVHRDLDVVLLDSQRPFGNGYLLPAGLLREKKSALLRSHLIVMTRTQTGKEPMPLSIKPTLRSRHVMAERLTSLSGEIVGWADLKGKHCIAFAGIARPDEFFCSLKEKGLSLFDEIPLADHQAYDAELLERLSTASRNCEALITTEKDAVKLAGVNFPVPCYQVGVELDFENVSIFDHLLRELLAKHVNNEQVTMQ